MKDVPYTRSVYNFIYAKKDGSFAAIPFERTITNYHFETKLLIYFWQVPVSLNLSPVLGCSVV